MRPPHVDPVRSADMLDPEGFSETHPAYGTAVFIRGQVSGGGQPLFGSRIAGHHDLITLQVCEAKKVVSYGQERVHSGAVLLEAHFSAVQFARLLTEMNMGSGVPCTLTRTEAGERPPLPAQKIELQHAVEMAKRRAAAVHERVRKMAEEVQTRLEGKVPKKWAQEVERIFSSFLTEVGANLPFYMKQVDEAAERSVAAAQAEVDSYLQGAIHRAGVEALKDPEIARRVFAPAHEVRTVLLADEER